MCHVDILGTHIVSAWYSLENQLRQLHGRGMIGVRSERVEVDAFWQAHFAVLCQASVVSPYIEEHKAELRAINSARPDTWLAKQHIETLVHG